MKPKLLFFPILLFAFILRSAAQPCTVSGDEITYGTGDVWIGYVYDNMDFTNYRSYVTEGTAGNPAFDQSFGGDYVNYTTTGCFTYTETFSVRYMLTKTFADGDYEFTVGGDDGHRLSIDGGATWLINRWGDQGYSTTTQSVHLNGTYSLVLEYYENAGGNRVSFDFQPTCTGTDDQSVYGTGNVWRGYVYDGTNFNSFKGTVTEGSTGNPNFDENFGGSNTSYSTSQCATQTETFSVRYRLRKYFSAGTYLFVAGGDDGYRLSLDGGTTWVINYWNDQSYTVNSYSTNLNGTYDMVLDYYENGGDNRISLSISSGVLPIHLIDFTAKIIQGKTMLNWNVTENSTVNYFEIEKSSDGNYFTKTGTIPANEGIAGNAGIAYSFTDNNTFTGSSYYRIRMIDLSGEVTYSGQVQVRNLNASRGISVYPTITQGNVSIVTGERLTQASFVLVDMKGRRIYSKFIGNINAGVAIPVSLPSTIMTKGMYLLQIFNNGTITETKKIILQ